MEALFGIFFLFFIANFVLVVWALIDAIKVPHDSVFKAGTKLIWLLVILFAGFVGAIIYFAVGRPAPGADHPVLPHGWIPIDRRRRRPLALSAEIQPRDGLAADSLGSRPGSDRSGSSVDRAAVPGV